MIQEIDVPRPLPIAPHKLGISRRPLTLGVARQHALYTYANALDIVHGTPALRVEEVETYDAVAVDVRVQGDFALEARGGEG